MLRGIMLLVWVRFLWFLSKLMLTKYYRSLDLPFLALLLIYIFCEMRSWLLILKFSLLIFYLNHIIRSSKVSFFELSSPSFMPLFTTGQLIVFQSNLMGIRYFKLYLFLLLLSILLTLGHNEFVSAYTLVNQVEVQNNEISQQKHKNRIDSPRYPGRYKTR